MVNYEHVLTTAPTTNMDIASQLEAEAQELATSMRVLVKCLRDEATPPKSASSPTTAFDLTIPTSLPTTPNARFNSKLHEARKTVLAKAAKTRALLAEPDDFLQQLAIHSQLIACLQWLGDFQVLACIPPTGSVPIKDVAQLSAVPEAQLLRVIRMTATAGFLREPCAGHVAHTTISAQFLSQTSYRDATMFLAEHAAPAALQMASRTRQLQGSEHLVDNPKAKDALTSSHGRRTFQQVRERGPKFERQWAAYLKHTGGENHIPNGDVTEVLTRLDWSNLGSACVVEACVTSSELSSTLADLYPALRFVVQLDSSRSSATCERCDLSVVGTGSVASRSLAHQPDLATSRITVESRLPGTPQTVRDAAVYIIAVPPSTSYLSSTLPDTGPGCFRSWLLAELKAHIDVLSASSGATLIVSAPPALPRPGTIDSDIEGVARLRDLSLLQLFDEHEMEMLELIELVHSVHNSSGQLVVVNQLQSRRRVTVALCVKYQPVVTQSQSISDWW